MWRLLVLGVIILCGYVGWRSAQALFVQRWQRLLWLLFILLTASGFFLGLPLRGTTTGVVLRFIGAAWMVSLPYWLLAVLFFDGLRWVDKRRPFFPRWVKENYVTAKRMAFAATVGIVSVIFLYGYWRFEHPVTTPVAVQIAKPGGKYDKVRIAVAADLHLGDLIGKKRLTQFVAQINAVGADLIVLPGDIVDSRLEPLREQNMHEELARLKAPLGVYAVLGNHEGFAGDAATTEYLESCGIRVLRDEALLVNGSFYLVGRKDWRARGRKNLSELLGGLDRGKPVILVDHQPHALDEPALRGVDLQLSGHTHHGQVWPISWILRWLYEVPYGLARKGDFQVYVTSGLGLWGFPARIGTVSEVVDMEVSFERSTTP